MLIIKCDCTFHTSQSKQDVLKGSGVARIAFKLPLNQSIFEADTCSRVLLLIVSITKFLDHDWFSSGLFVAYSAHDKVGVQLQVSNSNFS